MPDIQSTPDDFARLENRRRRAVLLADALLMLRHTRPRRARLALWLLGLSDQADALYENRPL